MLPSWQNKTPNNLNIPVITQINDHWGTFAQNAFVVQIQVVMSQEIMVLMLTYLDPDVNMA